MAETKTKKCSVCKRQQKLANFPHLGNNVHGEKCYVCKSKEETEQLKKAANERFVERELKKRRRELMKNEAEQRAKQQIKNKKNYQKQRSARLLAEQEFARRELQRRHLLYYIMGFNPGYKAGWVHRHMCERVENFVRGVIDNEDPRIMMCMPPRTGKSTVVSVEAPSWILGKYPWMEFISGSYGLQLPVKFSRSVRGRLRDPQYRSLFNGTVLDPDNQNVEGWMTTKGGIYVPAGIGVGVTGMGANIFNIDDPFKDSDDADSPTQRDKVWDWYGSVAYTRLAPNSGIMLTATRWHDDDLCGRVLEQQKDSQRLIETMQSEFEQELTTKTLPEREIMLRRAILQEEIDEIIKTTDWWDVVVYSALAEHDEYLEEDNTISFDETHGDGAKLVRKKGDALHPERYPRERLLRIRRTLQPRHWNAMYQQNPVPDEGEFIQKDYFRFVPPQDWRRQQILIAGDLAIGTKAYNDYTVFSVGVLDFLGQVQVIDLIRGRFQTDKIQDIMIDLCQKYYHSGDYGVMTPILGVERGSLYEAVMPGFKTKARSKSVRYTLEERLKPVTDKDIRARPLQGMMQQGTFMFVNNAPWLDTARNELLRFPAGRYNDIVDSLAWLARMAQMVSPPVDKAERNRKRMNKSFKDRIKDYMKGQNANKNSHMGA